MTTANLDVPRPQVAPPRVLRVGQDLDGVHYLFDRAYYTGCVALDRIKVPFRPANTWDFYHDEYGHSVAEFLTNCHDLADLGWLWDGPMIPGGRTMWDALIDAGHEVHVITDRSFGTHPIASHVGTRMWLASKGRKYHSLTFTADKTAVPTDIMLEDKLENYDDLDAAGCQVWLINRPWNEVPGGDDRRRVNTHDQFLAKVHALAEEFAAV